MALTPDDLAAISKLLEGQEQRLENKIEKTAEATEQRLEEKLAKKIESAAEISKQEILEGVGDLFEKTWKLMDENKEKTDKRLTELEELAHSHKN